MLLLGLGPQLALPRRVSSIICSAGTSGGDAVTRWSRQSGSSSKLRDPSLRSRPPRWDQPLRPRSPRPAYDQSDSEEGGNTRDSDYARWERKPFYETKRSTIREQMFGEALYGVAPVLTALQYKRRQLHALYLQDSVDLEARKDSRALQQCIDLAEAAGAAVHRVPKHELNLLSDNRPHQGLVLDCSELTWESLEDLPDASSLPADKRYPVWLALDEVVDPQNLGAIVRSAYCLGVSGVLACKRNCAPLSATASKASAGTLEAVTLYSCRQLPRTLEAAAGAGWTVLGATAGPNATPCRDVDVDGPTVLVMGGEGYGLRTLVRRACHSLVMVEMSPPPGSVVADSLNVSVAAGVLLHHITAAAADAQRRAAPRDVTAAPLEALRGARAPAPGV